MFRLRWSLKRKIRKAIKGTNVNIKVLMEAVDHYAFILRQRATKAYQNRRQGEEYTRKEIARALMDAINTHGPITKANVISAVKRIYGNLKGQ